MQLTLFVTRRPFLILILSVLVLTNAWAVEFYFNTRDGLGFAGAFDVLQYTLGYPFSKLQLTFAPIRFLGFELSGGYDFSARTFVSRLVPELKLEEFELGMPATLKFRQLTTDEATEIGRFDIGLMFAWNPTAKNGNAKRPTTNHETFEEGFGFEALVQYSPMYVYYDPTFNVNIIGFRTESIFRASVEFKAVYYTPFVALGMGYSAFIRWLSYRSTFITSQDTFFFEARFKVKF